MQPRKLNIININDQLRLEKETPHIKNAFNVIEIPSYIHLQQLIIGKSGVPKADLLLIDIDMSARPRGHGHGFFWSDEYNTHVRPYGPLLALPFLGNGKICSFIPYSTMWTDPAIINNGYLMLAVSTLLASINQKQIEIHEVEDLLTSMNLIINAPHEAIEASLKNFRHVIKTVESMQIYDADKVLNKLDIQVEENLSKGMLVDEYGNELAIILSYNGQSDSILLASLFGDIVGLNTDKLITNSEVKNLKSVLTEWIYTTTFPREYISDSYHEQQIYCAKFEEIEYEDKVQSIISIYKSIISKKVLFSRENFDDMTIRAVVHLAWADAWTLMHEKHSICHNTITLRKSQSEINSLNKELMILVLEQLGLILKSEYKENGKPTLKEANRRYLRLFGGNKETQAEFIFFTKLVYETEDTKPVERFRVTLDEEYIFSTTDIEKEVGHEYLKDIKIEKHLPYWLS